MRLYKVAHENLAQQSKPLYSKVFIAICWAHTEKPKTHNSHPFYKVKYW